MTSESPQPYTGTLSLTLHQARHLPSTNVHHNMSPVCSIQLPHCHHTFATPPHINADTRPVWNAEFDLNLSCCAPEDSILIAVWSDERRKDALGLVKLSMREVGSWTADDDGARRGRWYKLDREGVAAGELLMSMEWKGKGGNEGERQRAKATGGRRREVQQGRFVVSDSESSDEESSVSSPSSDSETESTRPRPLPVRQAHADSGSDSGSRESISGTATTETDSSDGSTGLTASGGSSTTPPGMANISDRRSASAASPTHSPAPSSASSASSSDSATMKQSSSYPSISPLAVTGGAFALPEADSYHAHHDRHLSSFFSLTTAAGLPPLHSSGRHGLLYDDTTSFDDRNFLTSSAPLSSLCVIRVWSRDYIHGLQLTYSVRGEHVTTPAYLGKVHTTEHVLKLHHSDGEYVIGVEGTYREWLETLTVITNRRSHTFGGNVDHRQQKWAPAGSKQKAVSFRCEVPSGHRVVGFEGGYGVHLHNLGVFTQPISSNVDGKRSKACSIIGRLKKKFSNSRLDTLRETAQQR